MATELRPAVANTENKTTKAGIALTSAVELDSITGVKAQGALVAKNPSDQLVYLATNANSQLIVDVGGATAAPCVSDEGTVDNGSATFADVATAILALSKTYENLHWTISCFRDTIYEIVYIDDVGGTPTETLIKRGRLSNTQNDICCSIDCDLFETSGGTGTQHLVLRARNLNAQSDIDGAIWIHERAQ